MVKIDSTSGLADMRLSDFHQKQCVTTTLAYLGGMFGEDR